LSRDDKYRLWTPLQDFSPMFVQAVLLHEDRHFYHHFAVNPVSLVRAVYSTYLSGERRVGGSTISMQVARLHHHLVSRSLSGKLSQIARAIWLELRYSKREILEAYLNLIPYGQNIEGAPAASLIYFGKPVQKLGLYEALTLAVIPQSPQRRAPGQRTGSAETAPPPETAASHGLLQARAALFAKWLREHPADRRDEALLQLPLTLRSTHALPFRAPHFVDNLLAQAARSPTAKATATTLHTTLDLSLQTLVERQLKGYVDHQRRIGIDNAAALLVDVRDASVRAAVGSADYFGLHIEGQVNGLIAHRSPGSALKPFIYALGIDQGILHPLTMLKDTQQSFGTYSPENFDGRFAGPLSAQQALVRSRNVPALAVAAQLTNPSFYSFLKRTGISRMKSEEHYGLSLVLGGGEISPEELAMLYTALAHRGLLRPLRSLLSEPHTAGLRILSEEASFMTLDMLKDNPRPGDNDGTLAPRFTVEKYRAAWKTGTSYGFRDAWTAGVIGPYVLIVWIGRFNAESNPVFVGATAAAPLFFSIADALFAKVHDLSEPARPLPKNLTRVQVCAVSGGMPTSHCTHTRTTWFIPGRSPIARCEIHRPVRIDLATGKQLCRPSNRPAKVEVYEFWPSDLLRLFQQAGLPRRTPPPPLSDAEGCDLTSQAARGNPPQISSPLRGAVYTLLPGPASHNHVALSAVADADATEIFWFVGASLLGKTRSGTALMWQPTPGKYIVRAVDDHGRSDSREVTVAMAR
jgi:penicillin-binding protein 1C